MPTSMTATPQSTVSFELTHEGSGATVRTTPPLDNGGDGTSFSPTDLCAVSLGACASTIMGLYARKKGFQLLVSFKVTKEMESSPRRIGHIGIAYTIQTNCSSEEYEALQRITRTCPVRLSLHPDVQIEESFERQDLPKQ